MNSGKSCQLFAIIKVANQEQSRLFFCSFAGFSCGCGKEEEGRGKREKREEKGKREKEKREKERKKNKSSLSAREKICHLSAAAVVVVGLNGGRNPIAEVIK